jgi:hypothetical protein
MLLLFEKKERGLAVAKGARGGKRGVKTASKVFSSDEVIDALQRFTSNQYTNIRKAQNGDKITYRKFDIKSKTSTNVDVTDKYKSYGDAIEQFVNQGGGYKNTLYRGISVDDTTLSSFKAGQTINQQGLSSWTTSEKTAANFSDRGKNKVVFIEKSGSKRTRNVDKYSTANKMDGNEYIQSAKNKQKIQQVEKKNGITYVYVKEI